MFPAPPALITSEHLARFSKMLGSSDEPINTLGLGLSCIVGVIELNFKVPIIPPQCTDPENSSFLEILLNGWFTTPKQGAPVLRLYPPMRTVTT